MSLARDIADLASVTTRLDTVGASEGALSNRNLIINGEFFVSQRGDYSSATSASTGTYYMDRWAVDFSGVTATIQNQSTDLPNGVTAKTFKLAATSSATGYLQVRQKIEPASYMDNRKVTVSAYVRSNSSLPRLRIEGAGASSTNIDGTQTHTGGGDWEKLTFTTTLKDGITAFTVGCILWNGSTVSISSGDYVEISQFQVEFGDTATDFEHRTFADELAKCQRYFYRQSGTKLYYRFGVGFCTSTTNANTQVFFPVPMRTEVAINSSGTLAIHHGTGPSVSTITGLSIDTQGNGTQGITLDGTTSSLTAGNVCQLIANNDSSAYIDYDAEL